MNCIKFAQVPLNAIEFFECHWIRFNYVEFSEIYFIYINYRKLDWIRYNSFEFYKKTNLIYLNSH